MCLDFVNIPEKKEGIGYKLVRRNGKKSYLPFWPYRDIYNDGATDSPDSDFNPLQKVTTTYTIGNKTITDLQYTQRSKSGTMYQSGIHHYKSIEDLLILESRLDYEGPYAMYTIIECKYEDAFAEDVNTIVSKTTTPIREIYVGTKYL